MTAYIALIRGINVGGHKKLAMAGVRDLLTKLGFADVKTLLQSGNVVFQDRRTPSQLEHLLETETEKRLGLEVAFFVRTAKEWQEMIAGNPFVQEAKRDPGHLMLMLFKRECDAKAFEALQAAIKGREIVRGGGRHAYFVYPDGVGRSKLTHAVIEKTLGTRGTARNWNTVLKLAGV